MNFFLVLLKFYCDVTKTRIDACIVSCLIFKMEMFTQFQMVRLETCVMSHTSYFAQCNGFELKVI